MKENVDPYAALEFPGGRIAFEGLVRVDEEGVDEFRVELPGRVHRYGAWRCVFVDDVRFHVEIITFGYASKFNVGNPHPQARVRFTHQEIAQIEELVRRLFAAEDIRKRLSPFNMKGAEYTGDVNFVSDWILQE